MAKKWRDIRRQPRSAEPYALAYLDNGDILAEYDTREQAHAALAQIVKDAPELGARLGILPPD